MDRNKGGRPRRVEGETLQRLSLSLRPAMRVGAELIARHRKVSLSQACEYALATVLREIRIGDESAMEIAERVADYPGFHRYMFATLLPDSLLDPQELYARDCWVQVAAIAKDVMDGMFNEWEGLYMPPVLTEAEQAFQAGLPLDEGVQRAIAAGGLLADGAEAKDFIHSIRY